MTPAGLRRRLEALKKRLDDETPAHLLECHCCVCDGVDELDAIISALPVEMCKHCDLYIAFEKEPEPPDSERGEHERLVRKGILRRRK